MTSIPDEREDKELGYAIGREQLDRPEQEQVINSTSSSQTIDPTLTDPLISNEPGLEPFEGSLAHAQQEQENENDTETETETGISSFRSSEYAPALSTGSTSSSTSNGGNKSALSFFISGAINVILPFINGMMLGFGEIFAHELGFKWGWTGARVSQRDRRQIGPGVSVVPENETNSARRMLLQSS